ncbi:hypothetical protein [Streptomyces sp. HUAS TT20]|uniref:hypothetical protein n=1 Tax=Streptomyces sp. HUAS TT20 TaxID=3447509 RepID=UPI0021D98B92|nr:hypothetical protein [Streptomyces sp. HUAS 15-9]UXY33097.1 hypothetical protein N8I87_43105 [Streptomyces sp. HUAS 15-9]
MALTRPAPTGENTDTATAEPRPARERRRAAYAELPPPVEVALRAVRLEAQLGDPADPANRYGLPALSAVEGTEGPPSPADLRAEFRPRAAGGHYTSADQLVRVLRPLFRRDLALGHAWGTRPLLAAADSTRPAPARPAELAALLGPVALIAATGTVLRTAVRIVDEVDRREPAARQWHGTLAGDFADLLACESLTTVALRSLVLPAEATALLTAAVGYVVPQLMADVHNDLELVLNESGFAPGSLEQRSLAKLRADLATGGQWPDPAACLARLVAALPDLAENGPGEADATALFRIGDTAAVPADLLPEGTGCHHVLADALATAAAARPAEGEDGALARAARRLRTERRTLRLPCLQAADASPEDPAARALADRQAQVLLAAAVLGVRRAADHTTFLSSPDWALLALVRLTERLGVPRPPVPADPRDDVWAELAERGRRDVDCDVYATKSLW